MTHIWLFVVAGGPLLLLAALVYAMVRYSRRDRSLDRASDAGARQVRREEERDKAGIDPGAN